MKIKQAGVIAVAAAAGFVVATLTRPDRTSDEVPAAHQAGLTTVSNANDLSLRADLERQIAELKSQLEAARFHANTVSGRAPKTPEEAKESRQKIARQIDQARAAIDKDKLLAAGYSMQRIEWIQRRSQELQEEYARESEIQRQNGTLDANVLAAHFHDEDIGLRSELGDDEYARYRQALGRPIGMEVGAVSPSGGGAELKVGDQIISYNGTRIFSIGELGPEMKKYASSGTTIPVDVLRDGQKIRMNVPAGSLSVQQSFPGQLTSGQTIQGQPIEGRTAQDQVLQGWIKQVSDLEPKLREIRNAESRVNGGGG